MPDDKTVSPERLEGPTPNGGAYALIYRHEDGSLEIVEFTAQDVEIGRTYSERPAKS
jgi:hypothetical protein